MKRLVIVIGALAFCALPVQARSTHVHGYVKKSGTYVMPSHRTTPNRTRLDNYSTKGNINPYTGKKGSKSPFKSYHYKTHRR